MWEGAESSEKKQKTKKGRNKVEKDEKIVENPKKYEKGDEEEMWLKKKMVQRDHHSREWAYRPK